MNICLKIVKERNEILHKAFSRIVDTFMEGVRLIHDPMHADVTMVLHPDVAKELMAKRNEEHIVIALLALPPKRQIDDAKKICAENRHVSMCYLLPSDDSETPEYRCHIANIRQQYEARRRKDVLHGKVPTIQAFSQTEEVRA